jgi:hypothetical protein
MYVVIDHQVQMMPVVMPDLQGAVLPEISLKLVNPDRLRSSLLWLANLIQW